MKKENSRKPHQAFFVLAFILLGYTHVMAQDAYRSTGAGGDWGTNTTWEKATSISPHVWTAAGIGEIPGTSDTVYLEAGTTVTLSSDQSVASVHFNNTADVVRLSTGNNTLDIHGKIRIYESAAPGTSRSSSAGVSGWINTGTSGRLRFVGSTSRIVVEKGEFGAKLQNRDITVEFAMDPGDTAYIDESVRFGNVTVSSGVLRVLDDHTFRPTETETKTGVVDGNLTVNSGATMYGGRGIFRNKNTSLNSVTVEAGARLIFTYEIPLIAAQTININGSLELLDSATGQGFPIPTARFGASNITTSGKLVLGGGGNKTMVNNFTVSDTVEILDNSPSVTVGAFTFDYDVDGVVLVYSNSSAITTSNLEFPADGSVSGLVLSGTESLTLNEDKVVTGNINLNGGTLLLGDHDLIVGSTGTTTGTPSVSSMIITNGTGRMGKVFNGIGSFDFPIGTNFDSVTSSSAENYYPLTIEYTSGTFDNDTIRAGARNNFFIGETTSFDSISVYWEVAVPANLNSAEYNATYIYDDTDVVGTESRIGSYVVVSGETFLSAQANTATNTLVYTGHSGNGIFTGRSECKVANNTLTAPENPTYCLDGTIDEIVGSTPVFAGTADFIWEESVDGAAFTVIPGAVSLNYTPPPAAVAGTYRYRRGVNTDICLVDTYSYSDTVTLTVAQTIECNRVGYYQFDGCDITEVANQAGGTPGTFHLIKIEDGFEKQGAVFNGTTSTINLGSDASLDFTDAFSLSLWVKTSRTARQTVLVNNRAGSSFSYILETNGGIPRVVLGGLSSPGPYSATTNIADGDWHHISVSWNAGDLNVYVDGVVENSQVGLAGAVNVNSVSDISLGKRSDRSDIIFEGSMDEVMIHTRAISSAEVSALASAVQNSVPCISSNTIVGYWAFDDNLTPTLLDSINETTDGLLQNGASYTEGFHDFGIAFDGVNDRAVLYDSTWKPSTGDAFSYSFRIKPSDISRSRETILFRESSSFSIVVELDQGVPKILLGGLSSPGLHAANTTLSIGTWYHIGVTYANGTLTWYNDGVEDGQITGLTGDINFNSGFNWLGMRPDKVNTRQFQGVIDEVKIFNFELSGSEMLDDFNSVTNNNTSCTTSGTPVGTWKFDDCLSATAVDSMGLNNGILNGTTRGAGYSNAGMLFDGVNDYINLGTGATFEFSNTFTISYWANTTQTGSRGTIVAKNKDGGTFSYVAEHNNGIPSIGLGSAVSNSGPFSATTNIADGTWHHVAFRYDNGTLSIFVDGVLEHITPGILGGVAANSGQELWVGGRNDKTNRYFNGTLDEVKLFNVALCDSEITELANLTQASSDCSGSKGAPSPTTNSVLTEDPVVEAAALALSVYPNPNTGSFEVQLNTKLGTRLEVSLVSLVGKEVYHYSGTYDGSSIPVHIDRYSPGVYVLRVSSEHGKITKQVILE